MDLLSILLLVLVALWFVLAVIYMVRHRGCGCGRGCACGRRRGNGCAGGACGRCGRCDCKNDRRSE